MFAHFRFNNEVQGNDSIDKFVTRLRLRARDCRYADKQDEMIRDRIVFGTSSSQICEKLINEGEKLTLDRAIQIAQNYEYCRQQMATMSMVDTDKSLMLSGARNNNRITIRDPESRRRSPPPKTTNAGTAEKYMGRTKNM